MRRKTVNETAYSKNAKTKYRYGSKKKYYKLIGGSQNEWKKIWKNGNEKNEGKASNSEIKIDGREKKYIEIEKLDECT